MAEKRTVGHAYNIDFLNVVFAASSIVLFVSTIWMVWDDYDREWKNFQRRFVTLEQEVTRAQLQQSARQMDQSKLKTLRSQQAGAEKEVASNRAKIEQIDEQVEDLRAELYAKNQNAQFAKATYDVERYDYEVLRNEKSPRAEAKGREVEEMGRGVKALNLEVEQLTAKQAALQQQRGVFTKRIDETSDQLTEMTTEQTRLEKRLETLRPSVTTSFRNSPLVDFMAPTIKVRQIITPNIVDDVNFTRVPKMDRCQTCHLAIDLKGYEKYPQPFRTHPNLDVYLGGDSPHPIDQIGCTVCHEGMGQSVEFVYAAHAPRNEKQKHEWEEKYHWQEPHLWDYPMLPVGMTEASCAKCHAGEIYVPRADTLNLAYATYERAGCYACHKTTGFENLRKPGPNLTRIKSKLTSEWVQNWIRDPRAVKPATWMPKVWYNSNSSSPSDAIRNEVEIAATAAYLFASSEDHTFAVTSPKAGNVANGEQIVKDIGCLGCHVVGANEANRTAIGPRRTFGQPLQNVGNKTTYEWLYNWVRDPKHYSPETYMPDLRLTDAQVTDVATYLMTLKGPAGEGPKAKPQQQDVDATLLDYLKATASDHEARAHLAKFSAEQRQVELGRRAIGRYGCFSCHEIKGFETTQPIGVELSEEGSKLVTRLDFAFVDIHHEKIEWFHQKVKEPRSFDRGRVLEPLEKLRMPNYGASDEEAHRLVTALMSFQRQIQPAQALYPRSARADALSAGRSLVRRRNCISCHIIEGDGGDYRALVEDPSLAPPLLTPEGAKVQPDWLYAFLQTPITIRPWLAVRMPTFGLSDNHWNETIRYFGAISGSVGPFRTHAIVPASDLAPVGAELFTLLRCQQCHVLGTIPRDQPTANLAPDLRMAPERLQADWLLEWLKVPLLIQPGTRMPTFWPDYPQSPYPQLGGNAEQQIRAVRDHLLTFRGGPNPRRAPVVTIASSH